MQDFSVVDSLDGMMHFNTIRMRVYIYLPQNLPGAISI
jgi:hypothetical protein